MGNEFKRLSRRDALITGGKWVGGGALLLLQNSLLGCKSPSGDTWVNDISTGNGTGVTESGACAEIPSETAGPYPAHDDSAINVLRLSGVYRSDIRASLDTGAYTGSATATGVPLRLTLKLVDATNGCKPLSGYALYLWHCDASGRYSMYTSGITNETYLRGVQQTDANGEVGFTTIFPGCYDGRMPHIHFEAYPNLATAVDDSNIIRTSQLTFPMAVLNAIYNNVAGYASSKTNLARTSYSLDNVFSDGTTYQIATISGDYASGFVASLQVGIKPGLKRLSAGTS